MPARDDSFSIWKMPRRLRFYGWILLIIAGLVFFGFNRNHSIGHFEQPSSSELEKILDLQRLEIEREMEGYPYENLSGRNVSKLSDLTMDQGGMPKRSVIVSTWRSGSSFLGDLVSAHPASYYVFEPLLYLGIVRFRRPLVSRQPLDTLDSLFNCEFSKLGDYLEYRKTDEWHSDDYNRYLKKQCQKNEKICHNSEFSTRFCRMFPFQVAKVVGLELALMEKFLEDEKLGVKIVFLVRDPRGVLQSRKHLEWCKNIPSCLDPATLCSDMVSDYQTAVNFSIKFPKTFRVLRYEDLASSPQTFSKELYAFYGIHFHKDVKRFIDIHTKVSHGDAYSTFRNSNDVAFKWREKLTFDEINRIQENCHEAMRLWGYRLLNNSQQRSFNPLAHLSDPRVNYFQ